MKVLILSCNTGEGHNSCAAALEEECRNQNIPCDTEDALLVTTSEHAQRVKHVVDALKLTGRGDVL